MKIINILIFIIILSANNVLSQETDTGQYEALCSYYFDFEHTKLGKVLDHSISLQVEFGRKSDYESERNKMWMSNLGNMVLVDNKIISNLWNLTFISGKLSKCNVFSQSTEKKCKLSEVRNLISDGMNDILKHIQERISYSDDMIRHFHKEGRFIVKNEYSFYAEIFRELNKKVKKYYERVKY